MTAAEVERHLQSRQPALMGMVPERAPPTVPTEMFSNEPSMDSSDVLSMQTTTDGGEHHQQQMLLMMADDGSVGGGGGASGGGGGRDDALTVDF